MADRRLPTLVSGACAKYSWVGTSVYGVLFEEVSVVHVEQSSATLLGFASFVFRRTLMRQRHSLELFVHCGLFR